MKKTYIQPSAEAINLITEGAVANLVVGSAEGNQILSNKKEGFESGGWNSDNWTQAGEDGTEE